MNTQAKGKRIVRKVLKYLLDSGWKAENVEKTGKFIKSKDLFGLFDVIAIKKNRTKLIQVKSNRKPNLVKYNIFQCKYPHVDCEVWVYKDRKGFEIYRLWRRENNKPEVIRLWEGQKNFTT